MKLRRKVLIAGALLGSIGPLLLILDMLQRMFGLAMGAATENTFSLPMGIVLFPFVLFLMDSEFLPLPLQVGLLIGIVLLNISVQSIAGWTSGYCIERLRHISRFCTKSGTIFLLLIAFPLFFVLTYLVDFLVLSLLGTQPWEWFLPWMIL